MTLQRGVAARPLVDRLLSINGWLVFAFLYLPILVVVVFSFSASPNVGIWGGFSLRWYDRMLGNLIVTQFGAARNWPFGSALSGAILIVMLVATMAYFRTGGRTV